MHVRFARVRFVLELFFVFETKLFSITRWRVYLDQKSTPSLYSKTPSYIRRQYVRLFIFPKPWPIPYPSTLFASGLATLPALRVSGFRDSSRETRSRSAQTFRTSNNILPNLDPDESSSSVLFSGSHRGQSKFVEVRKLSAFALSPLLPFLFFFFFFFFFFFAYNPSVMRMRLRHQRQH